MSIYRKRKDSDTWHFCTNCPNWPISNYDETNVPDRPSHGELDEICKNLEKKGECKRKYS